MTSGGITKRTALLYASAAFFVAAILCALWGHDVVLKSAVLGVVFGIIASVGSWFCGLPQFQDADVDTDEWANAIK